MDSAKVIYPLWLAASMGALSLLDGDNILESDDFNYESSDDEVELGADGLSGQIGKLLEKVVSGSSSIHDSRDSHDSHNSNHTDSSAQHQSSAPDETSVEKSSETNTETTDAKTETTSETPYPFLKTYSRILNEKNKGP